MDAGVWLFAVTNALAGLALLLLAGALLLAPPRRMSTNLLALTLAMLGLSALLWGLSYVVRPWAATLEFVSILAAIASFFAYAAFIGAAVHSPIVAPLHSRAARWGLLGVGALAILYVLADPGTVMHRNASGEVAWDPVHRSNAAGWFALAASAVATLAAVDQWARAAEDGGDRARARSYLIAFLLFDVANLTAFSAGLLPSSRQAEFFANIVSPLAALGFAAFLVRAILVERLFDVDVRLRVGIERGTIAAVFAAVFFAVAQIVEAYLQTVLGWVVGALAATALLLALRPLRRIATRVGETVVPPLNTTPTQLAAHKARVYRAQLELAVAEEGGLNPRDRRYLDRLRESLELPVTEAARIEHDVLAQR